MDISMDFSVMATGDSGIRAFGLAGCAVGAAILYTGAMVAMKLWGAAPAIVVAAVIAVTLLGAVGLEIMALRMDRLGMVYIAILAAETLMIMGVAHFGFGESLSSREALGAAFIVAGAAIAAT
jgi:hypothetical protein